MPDVIDSPADAEAQAAVWMIGLGFSDAMPTQLTGDSGIDVVAARAVAQVKFQVAPVGRPALQNLIGAAAEHQGKIRLFFAWKGYTGPAFVFAEQTNIALFCFSTSGDLLPQNMLAEHLCSVAAPLASATGVDLPAVELPAPTPAPEYEQLPPPSLQQEWTDWLTPRRLKAIGAGVLGLLVVAFFATHTDLLIKIVVFAGFCYLCWFWIKVGSQPKKRGRSRSRRRR